MSHRHTRATRPPVLPKSPSQLLQRPRADRLLVWCQVLTSPKDIEMWGDGLQTRSFTFIDDCVEGILRITKSDFKEPLNLGSSEMVREDLALHASSGADERKPTTHSND